MVEITPEMVAVADNAYSPAGCADLSMRSDDERMKAALEAVAPLEARVRELERTVLDDLDIIRRQKEGYEANVKIVADRLIASEARVKALEAALREARKMVITWSECVTEEHIEGFDFDLGRDLAEIDAALNPEPKP